MIEFLVMSKLFKREEFWVIFLIIFSVGITLNLFVNEVWETRNLPNDRFATYEFNFLPDFNAYLSKMTQGARGEVLVHERFTAEPHEGSLLQILYLILGKIGIGIMGMRVDVAYHFWRFVLAVVRLAGAYYFILAVLPGKEKKLLRILSFALFIFAGNFPFKVINPAEFGIVILGEKYRLVFDTWTNLDPLIRLSYLPHWAVGQTCMMLVMGMLVRAVESRSLTILKSLKLGSIGMVGGFILPSVPLILIPVWFLVTIIRRKNILGFLLGSFFMAIPLLYVKWVTQFVPWSALTASDQGVIMKFPWEGYLKALGVLGIGLIGVIGLIGRENRKNLGFLVAVLWVGVTMGMLFFFDSVFHYDQRRFVQVGVELPLAVLTVVLISAVVSRLLKWLKLLKYYGVILIIIVFLLLIPSVFVWYISYMGRVTFVRQRIWAIYPLVSATPYVVYQPNDWMEGIFWLSKNTGVNDIVFSDYVAGNYIAGYAGNRVYVGHGGQTPDYLNKLLKVKDFFSGKMKEKDAWLFLNSFSAKYVFIGPQEADYKGTLKYSFLEPVYTGKTTNIYKVN